MEVFGYMASIVIGVLLGLIGGGGSILNVPVLVYLFHLSPLVATGYSLFIVGMSSAIGSISYFKNGLVNLPTAIQFGIPSIVSALVTRRFILPLIPEQIVIHTDIQFSRDLLLMVLFAIIMLFASFAMLKKNNSQRGDTAGKEGHLLILMLQGGVVGLVTGLVGAGGGFLIIPALMFIRKLSMKEAVGTSLLIIAANSLFSFFGQMDHLTIDWLFLLELNGLSILGIILGTYLSTFINGAKLKPAFGVFVLVMGLYIIAKEVWF